MKTTAVHGYVILRTIRHLLPLAVVAFIAICSDAGLAQETVSKSLPQPSDTAATRQRRTSSEREDAVIVFSTKPEVPRAGRRVFVRSNSLLVRGAVVEDK